MKYLQKQDLPERVVKELGLDHMTEMSWSATREGYPVYAHQPISIFAGMGLVTVLYETKVEKTDHPLLKDDPYSVVQGEVQSVNLQGERPMHATHYCLGPKKHQEHVQGSGRQRQGVLEDIFPIVYIYHNQFTPFKKE